MKTVLAIRHVHFEGLGSFETVLRDRGAEIRYLEAGRDALGGFDPVAPDLLVVLGGPIGACEDDHYPFLTDEARALERRLAADRATLGICLGAQLMARVLGARIFPAAEKEIGWAPLTLTEAGRRSSLRHLAPEETAVLHWHGDTFDLPEGADHLASSDICANQAFAWGTSALAFQFHPECHGKALEQWFIGHAFEIASAPNVSVGGLRADTTRWSAAFERQGRKCLEEWLDQAFA